MLSGVTAPVEPVAVALERPALVLVILSALMIVDQVRYQPVSLDHGRETQPPQLLKVVLSASSWAHQAIEALGAPIRWIRNPIDVELHFLAAEIELHFLAAEMHCCELLR